MSEPTLVIGEALVDVVHEQSGEVREHVGGSPLNVAVGLQRLGHPTELACWFAADERGEAIRSRLAEDGVTIVAGSDGAQRTSTATATLDESGAATYEFDLDWQVPIPLPQHVGHVHTGSIAALLQPGAADIEACLLAHRMRGTVSYDPNARPQLMGSPADARQQVEQLVGLSDVVKLSDEDATWLYDGAPYEVVAQEFGRLGPFLVVVTRGGDGAFVHLPWANESREIPGRTVEVVDTVGAGDSFMSGLISGLLDAGFLGGVEARERLRWARWEEVAPALDRALATSAITVSRAGANPPTRADLTR